MADNNNPRGIGLSDAQNAISAMLAPQVDTAEETDALQTEAEGQPEAEVEMVDDQVDNSFVDGSETDLDDEDGYEEADGQSFDVLSAIVEIDGEEMTVEELRKGNLRQRDYTRKTQELAEARKAMEAQNQAIEQERLQYAQLLPALAQRIEQSAQPEPDWDTLYKADPVMAARAERQWRKQTEEREAQLQAVAAERKRLIGLEQQKLETMRAQYLEQQRNVLPDIIPEWRDSKVAASEASAIKGFLLGEGFTDQDIAGLTNATLVKLARKAMLYDRGETRANEVKAKPSQPRAKTLKSGSRGTAPRAQNETQKQRIKLKQTGHVKDAAALIKNLL